MDAPIGFAMSHTGLCQAIQEQEASMKQITTIGLDLAKTVFQVHCADEDGMPVLRKKLRRFQVADFIAELRPCLVGLEACAGAHH